MSHENGRKAGRSRALIVLSSTYREEMARRVLEPTAQAARRIEGATPRPGSIDDIKAFERFAETLRLNVAVAVAANTLRQFELGFPEALHLSSAIAKRMTPIPGLSLLIDLTETGPKIRLVGRDIVSRSAGPVKKQ